MPLRCVWITAAVICFGLAAGCASYSARPHPSGTVGGRMSPPIRLVERGKLTVDLEHLPAGRPEEEAVCKTHRAADAEEVASLAAAADPLANLLSREAQAARDMARHGRHHPGMCVLADAMDFRAAHERNEAAARALTLLYRLAEAEASRDVLQRSLAAARQTVAHYEQLQQRGFDLDLDESEVRSQELELLDRQAELQFAVERLNLRLREALGWDVDDATPIWPEVTLGVGAAPDDAEAEVALGLAIRGDLAAIATLCAAFDHVSLDSVRSTLGGVDPMLGAATVRTPAALHLLGSKAADRSARRGQLDELLAHRQRAAAQEIREAVFQLDARRRQVQLAREQVLLRQRREAELKQLWGDERITAFDLAAAESKKLAAENELVRHVVAWHVAHVEWMRATGRFALLCGYVTPTCDFPDGVVGTAGEVDRRPLAARAGRSKPRAEASPAPSDLPEPAPEPPDGRVAAPPEVLAALPATRLGVPIVIVPTAIIAAVDAHTSAQ